MSTLQKSKHYRREVTGQERRFLFSPTSNISLVLRLRGSIAEEALAKAVEKMLETYPLFGVKLEWDEDVRWSTTEGAAEVPIKVHHRESDDTWIEVLNKEAEIPIRPSQGPLTRFVLIKGNNVSELMIMCHHIICDGRSMEFALREVLLHLGDPSREPPSVPESPSLTPEVFPKGASINRVRAAMIRRINKKWLEEKVAFDEEDLVEIWQAVWKNTRCGLEILEFNEDETQKLIEVSRANNVTLNSTILIALVKARYEVSDTPEAKLKIATAVDARKRLSVDCSDAVGFYAGGSFVDFTLKEGKSLWDNIRSYHKDVSKHLKSGKIFTVGADHFVLDQTMVDAMTFAIAGDQVEPHQSRYPKISEYASRKEGIVVKMFERMIENTPEIMSTNLGVLDIPGKVSGIEVERVFFNPTSANGMDIVLGIATVNGRLTITLNYYHGYADGAKIAKVRVKAEEILQGLIKR
jgi:NRPS condensation-like uncharacterized protein